MSAFIIITKCVLATNLIFVVADSAALTFNNLKVSRQPSSCIFVSSLSMRDSMT
jgi:hypothetical protein